MQFTNVKYTQTGSITAIVDGQELSIPVDPGNRHYAEMLEQGITPEPYTPPPPTAEQIRSQRNVLLAASDWTQVADAPVDKEAWAIYRQALRDVTGQAGFPENVIWPEEPMNE